MMTNEEMLGSFEMHRIVRFRDALCKIVGVEFHGPATADQGLVFILVHLGVPNWVPQPALEANAHECMPARMSPRAAA